MLKVDLHTHTSDDPFDRIPYSTSELIDRAAGLGYDALAVTLHDRQLDIRRLIPYAAERGIVLIPGIERSIHGRHVLLLNFKSGAEYVHSFDDLARLKRQQRGLVIAPHPFFPSSAALGRHLERHAALFDAVEWNAMFTADLNFNRRAKRWAARHGKPMVGNGDIHRLYQLDTTYSLVDAERDPEAICAAVAAGRVEVKTQPISWPRAIQTIVSLVCADFVPGRSVEIGATGRSLARPARL